MRSILKAFASDHPIIVFFAVAARWVLWTAAGSPLAVAVAVVAVQLGQDWRITVGSTSATVLAVTGWGLWGSGGRRFRWVWLWWRMCRFRLRWPTVMASVAGARQTVVAKALSSNNYSVPGGLRPILDAPVLGWFPRIDGPVVSWTVRPAAGRTLGDLSEQADRIAAAYRIVERVDVDYDRATAHRGRVVVSFADELSKVQEPAWA